MTAAYKSILNRRGYTLVFYAMLLWAIFGLAALVIDLGLVRAKFRHMQSATDTAALEGMRGILAGDSTARSSAQQLAASTFMNHVGSPTTSADIPFQREIGFDGADGTELQGKTLIDPRTNLRVPSPALNSGDNSEGDMVLAGSDFTVRLQRNRNTVDSTTNPAPPIPFLFARATTLHTNNVGNTGYAFEASSTATSGDQSSGSFARAMTMGIPFEITLIGGDTKRFAGVEYFEEYSVWNSPDPHTPLVFEAGMPTLYTLGTELTTLPTETTIDPTGYVAIYANISGVNRVVGFGYLESGVRVDQIATENASGTLSLVNAGSPADILQSIFDNYFFNVSNAVGVITLKDTNIP